MSTGAEKGREFLLKATTGVSPVAYVTVAGLRSTGLSINGEIVDITNKDSAGYQELLAGAGTTKASISASGVFENTTNELLLRTRCASRSIDSYKLYWGDGTVLTGNFQITKHETAGEHNKEVTYNVTLESSGVWSFA